ncbi:MULTISPECIES: hypothetical protein [Lactobacillaceae]|nr:hypothetical protein [Lactobacillus sp. HBUAS51381]
MQTMTSATDTSVINAANLDALITEAVEQAPEQSITYVGSDST